jgi:AraC family transcriptional regulator, arabinose operon regulatory protein
MLPKPLCTSRSFSSVRLVDSPRIFVSEKNWHWRTIIPDYYNLWYAVRGEGEITVDGVLYPIRTGTLFILAPGQHVQAMHNCNNPIHNYATHFHPVTSHGRRIKPASLPLCGVQVRNASLFEMIARHTVSHYKSGHDATSSLAAQWVCVLALQAIHDAHTPAANAVDQRMSEWAGKVASNPGNRLSIQDIAKETGLSRVHFTRRFKHVTGETPQAFIIRHRMDRAKELLRHSSMTLKEIADSLGYEDVYFFSRQFKGIVGKPPGAWRAAHVHA